jgi:ATP-dependent RNA helicase RhlE
LKTDFDFGFREPLMRAITDAGYETPTPIQAGAIPLVLTGADVIGTAQTGTGKTAAFVLPILQHLLDKPSKGVARVLIVCPTRELAEQINDAIGVLGKHTGITSATIYGGVGFGPQEAALRKGVDILVACPGRLLDHVDQRNTNFTQIDHLVLDEADRMFDMGFLPQVRRIVDQLPRKRQTLLFSATFPKEVEMLARDVLHDPKRVNVGVQKPATTIAHALYPVASHLKTKLLLSLVEHTNAYAMLVFTRTKHRADRLARVIEKAGFKAVALHGNRSQNQRQRALDGFKRGKVQVLVATDIASRGLDIENVSHVINFDVPGTPEDYIHRIGRTGRAERTGDAFTLVTPEDRDEVRDIERVIGKSIERRQLEGFDYNASASEQSNVRGGTEHRGDALMVERERELNEAAPERGERPSRNGGDRRPHDRAERPARDGARRPQQRRDGPQEQRRPLQRQGPRPGEAAGRSERPERQQQQQRREQPAAAGGNSDVVSKYPWMKSEAPRRPARHGGQGGQSGHPGANRANRTNRPQRNNQRRRSG